MAAIPAGGTAVNVRTRALAAVFLLLAAVGLLLVGSAPQRVWTPAELVSSPPPAGTGVQVRGVVGAIDASNGTFDLEDTSAVVRVSYTASLPEGFAPGREVIVDGVVAIGGGVGLTASRVTLGHAR